MEPDTYCTSYCNHPHRMKDGKPIRHECRIIPPEALRAERAGDFDRAHEIMEAKRLGYMLRGVRK
jgi:hypothetical protein